jgi:hypothetical protein
MSAVHRWSITFISKCPCTAALRSAYKNRQKRFKSFKPRKPDTTAASALGIDGSVELARCVSPDANEGQARAIAEYIRELK